MAEFNQPTEYEINKLELTPGGGDPIDVRGLFLSLEIYENIVLGGITGRIQIFDTDGAGLIEKGFQFNEKIEFSITSAMDEELNFTGWMNGIKSEVTKQQKKIYTIEFLSKPLRKNESVFITRAFRGQSGDTPGNIAIDMAEELDTDITVRSDGEPMTWISTRRKPLSVMKYVMSHGVTSNTTEASAEKGQVRQTAKGTTGFFFWETLDGYRFASGDDLIKGAYNFWPGFENKIAKRSAPLDESSLGIIDYEFPQLGDYQSKLRSGAFNNTALFFDIDKGEYEEQDFTGGYEFDKFMEVVEGEWTKPTRYTYTLLESEIYTKTQETAKDNEFDNTKLFQQQTISRQNTMMDQHGRFTLPAQFQIRAGDTIEVKINKTCSEGGPTQYDKKHTGKYLIKQVGHHIFADGRKAYTKLTTLRSIEQQDDTSSVVK